MINSNHDIKKTQSKVKKTMVGVKNSAKNSAILRNKTSLRSQLPASYRWTGQCDMLAKFNRMHGELVEAREEEDADFEMDESPAFKRKTEKLSGILSTIKITTKAL